LILLAKREDMGHKSPPASGPSPELTTDNWQLATGDAVTSRLLIPENAVGVGTLTQREVGIVCGLPLVQMICRCYDEALRVEQIPGFHLNVIEGRYSDAKRTPLLRVRGPLRSLLSAERVILNFLQHLSGVATQTHRFVRRVEGTGARIYDTRKTLPGFRLLDKYAVRCGGGHNHRMGLHDGLLVKDNHLAHVPIKELAGFVGRIVAASRREAPKRFVEVEVDNLDQFKEVLKVEGIDVILLDNMDCPSMEKAVGMRNAARKNRIPELEASGCISLEVVRSVAETGVERIAVGAITHSAPALDIGLDIESGT
jgi:nicotinate-nucleotide pyrophosphorylase (carboxylating)